MFTRKQLSILAVTFASIGYTPANATPDLTLQSTSVGNPTVHKEADRRPLLDSCRLWSDEE